MNTMEENKTGLNLIEVEGERLLTLLEGVISHAGRDKSLPTLNAIEIEGEGARAYLFTRTYYGYTLGQAKAQFKIALEGEGK